MSFLFALALAAATPYCPNYTLDAPQIIARRGGTTAVNTAAGDFNGDGKAELVADSGNGLMAGTTPLPTSSAPIAVAVADANRDGHADVIVHETRHLEVFLGDGHGAFRRATTNTNSIVRETAVFTEVNGDGVIDVMLVQPDGAVRPMLGDGKGSFLLGTESHIPPGHVAAGDFDGDGKTDLVSAGDFGVWVMKGDGAGHFVLPPETFAYAGKFAGPIFAADLNGDGKTDLIMSGQPGSAGQLWPLFSTGTGFVAGPIFAVSVSETATLADLNGDNRVDVATFTKNGVEVFLNDGRGGFAPSWSLLVSVLPYALTTGDFNGDGRIDLAAGGAAIAGNGDGTFRGWRRIALPGGGASAADVDGDGATDFATGDKVLHNDGAGNFTVESAVAGSQGCFAGDADGDGGDELVCWVDGDFVVAKRRGPGLYDPLLRFQRPKFVDGVAVVRGAIAVLGRDDATAPQILTIHPLDVSLPVTVALPKMVATWLSAGDVNGDGLPDLLITGEGSYPPFPNFWGPEEDGYVAVMFATAPGKFAAPRRIIENVALSNGATAGDFDGDGHNDVAVVDYYDGRLLIAFANANDGFFPVRSFGTGFVYVAAADLDGDGIDDLTSSDGRLLFGGPGGPVVRGQWLLAGLPVVVHLRQGDVAAVGFSNELGSEFDVLMPVCTRRHVVR